MSEMTIYRDVPVRIKDKMVHVTKIGGKPRKGIIKTHGDIPVLTFNDITKQFVKVINPRGKAYATRRDLKFRRKHDDQ